MIHLSKEIVYDSARPRLVIWEDALELLRYRDLLWSLVQRDLTVRYKRSVLGFLWTMLNPLLTMLVLTIVFSTFFRFEFQHFAVYLLSGLLLWNFFAQSTTQAIHNLLWAGSLVNKIYLPKPIFVVSALLVGLVNLVLALIPLALIMLISQHRFSPALLFLPIPIALVFLFALGVGLFVTTLAIFFVDVVDIYQVGLMILFYLSPIIYPLSILPERYLPLVQLNPMYYFLQLFRQPIYDGTIPEVGFVWRAALIALVALIVGWWFFTKKADEFAYRV
ncbi:MAG: ABC transporter permease [Anaerolineae bacterium]|nr:ABC transporter permease [Anaerolineae bacterium]